MPGRKNTPDLPVSSTPIDIVDDGSSNAKNAAQVDKTQVVAPDGSTVDVKDAIATEIFGPGGKPPALPPDARGNSQDPATKTQVAQNVADQTLSGSANGPGLPKNNVVAAAQANDAETEFDFGDQVDVVRVAATLRADGMSVARAPHYFSEQTDNVFLCDILVYICGANVSPHIKGTVSWTYGLNDSPNTLSLTLDNSNNKFTITPENVIYNHFHAGQAPNEYGEYDESAKAKIWLYKNNQMPLPVGTGVFKPNTPPNQDAGGRRLPLNIYGSIFHRMDPIRVWIRISQYDEWLPVFTGYVMRKTHTDSYTDFNQEVSISASCIREPMRKMRVQHNSVPYVLPGATATSEGRSVNTTAHTPGTASVDDPTGTQQIAGATTFFNDILRTSTQYAFAWAGMSFKQISEYMTVGGFAPSILAKPARADADTQRVIGDLTRQLTKFQQESAETQNQIAYIENAIGQASTSNDPNVQKLIQSYKDDTLPVLRSALTSYTQEIDRINNQIKNLNSRVAGKSNGTDPVNGIGRMDTGLQLRYPVSLNQDSASKQSNVDVLDRWYRMCCFGSPVRTAKPPKNRIGGHVGVTGMDEKPDMSSQNLRYWTLDEIANPKTGAGTRCRWDDLWAPDNQLVHWLLPPVNASGAESTNVTDITLNRTVPGVRVWYTRVDMIEEFARMVGYRWWVTGVGDIVFEFPMYDFEPQDFGPWQDVMTVNNHAMESTLDEEAGDPPTMVIARGTFTAQPGNVNESNTGDFIPVPNQVVFSPNMVSRLGAKIAVVDRPFLNDANLLGKIAAIEFQTQVGESEQSSIQQAFRPWIHPNRPIKFVPRDRLSLTSSVTHSMTIFGMCSTTYDVNYTRQLDTTGLRRYITGGAHQPVSFGLIGGANGLRETLAQRSNFATRQLAHLPSLQDPAEKKKFLDQNVSRDTQNPGDKFPSGTDIYNIADFFGFDDQGKLQGNASAQARLDAQQSAQDAFASKQITAAGATAGISVTHDGVIYGSSGVQSTAVPQASTQKASPANTQNSISIGVGTSQDPKLEIGSDAANQLQQNIQAVNGFGAVDIFNLAGIISSATRDRDATQQEKIAVGWTVLNGAGANGSVKNLQPGSIANAAGQYKPNYVDQNSIDIARNILGDAGTPDPTGGATSFANYDPATPYDDPRICSAVTGQIVRIDPGNVQTVEGQPIQDIGKFVFFKRNPQREAQAQAKQPSKYAHLPAPFDKYEDITQAAAKKFGISEAVLCGYIKHECNGYYDRPERLKPNETGDIGAGTNWVAFEGALFEFAAARLTGVNALKRENNRVLATVPQTVELSTGKVVAAGETVRVLWHRTNPDSSHPSVFVKTHTVSADDTVFKGLVAGGVSLASFWSGDYDKVIANPTDMSLLKPYDLSTDPLTAIIASPQVNIYLSARQIKGWLEFFKGNSIQTVMHGKYSDMDLGGYDIDTYYKAAYGQGNAGQVATLLALALKYNSIPVSFQGVAVPVKAGTKSINVGGNSTYVPIVNGVACHGNGKPGISNPLGEYILKEAHDTFWPVIKNRGVDLLGACESGDASAGQELERRFQNGQTLNQVLQNLYKKQST